MHRNAGFALESEVTLNKGINHVSLLSAMVGLPVFFYPNPCFPPFFISSNAIIAKIKPHIFESQLYFLVCDHCLHAN